MVSRQRLLLFTGRGVARRLVAVSVVSLFMAGAVFATVDGIDADVASASDADGGVASASVATATVAQIPGAPPLGEADSNGVITELDHTGHGYEASEFFLEGTARSYHSVDDQPLTTDGTWSVAPDPAPTPAYRTRLQVLKPSDPSRFNGSVYLDWFNPAPGFDTAPGWVTAHVEIARQGAAVIGVSTKAAGVNGAKAAFPDRYASLDHPGDSYQWDIFSQAGKALRDQAEQIFGPAYQVEQLIPIGAQEPFHLVTYVNAFAQLHGVFDGYLLHTGGTGQPLREHIEGPPSLPAIEVPAATMIRPDVSVPVLALQTEDVSRAARQPDTAFFRRWEIAGSNHVDLYVLDPSITLNDFGTSPEVAERLFDGMVHPVTQPHEARPACAFGVNAGPGHWVQRAAHRHLDDWVRNGTPPPTAPPLATVDGTPTGELVLDEHGNATGGVRTPHLDVPVATLRGSGNAGPTFCRSFGATFDFSPEKLAQLYGNHGAFVSRWVQAVDGTVRAGFMTLEDGEFVKDSAATSGIGKKKK